MTAQTLAELAEIQVGVSKEPCVPFANYPQNGIETCSCCRVESVAGMEEHNFGKLGRKPICPLCHASLHLDVCGLKNAGVMIWMPELSQAQLNAMVTVIFASITLAGKNVDPEVDRMKTLYRTFEGRIQQIEGLFGGRNPLFDGTSPLFLAQQIEQAQLALARAFKPKVIEGRLEGLRFLAHPKPFSAFIRGATTVMQRKFPRDKWNSLIPDTVGEHVPDPAAYAEHLALAQDAQEDGPQEPGEADMVAAYEDPYAG